MTRDTGRLLWGVISFLAATPSVTVAQALPIDSGAVIRLHLHSGDTVVGALRHEFQTLESAITICPTPRAACAIAPTSASRSFDPQEVAGLDLRISSSRAASVRTGALFGGAAGALIWFLLGGKDAFDFDALRIIEIPFITATAGIGAIFGSTSSPAERWIKIPLR